ncbi:hypothetical protein KA529_01500 [Candidatus Saccharibacteria bacterium]|nr:hypothetical protein [Candidatus Saccharibacteria bacterium]
MIAFNRGGTWDNGPNSGAFTLNLENTPSDSDANIGFRAALAYQACEMTTSALSMVVQCTWYSLSCTSQTVVISADDKDLERCATTSS